MDPFDHDSGRAEHAKRKGQCCVIGLTGLFTLLWMLSRKERLASTTIFRLLCMVDEGVN